MAVAHSRINLGGLIPIDGAFTQCGVEISVHLRPSAVSVVEMSEHQSTTIGTYDEVAAEYLAATRDSARGGEWLRRFADVAVGGAPVADLGSGPGRDTSRLRAHGLDAFSLDLSMGMLRAGCPEYPADRVQGSLLSLPLRTSSLGGAWANASLLHFSPTELEVALREIHRALVPHAPLYLTVKLGDGSAWESSRYGRPRWFQYWSAAELDPLLDDAGFRSLSSSLEKSSSADWLVRLCRCETAGAT